MSDNISRQAAIDALYKCRFWSVRGLNVVIEFDDAYDAVRNLPSTDRTGHCRTGHWIEDEYGIAHCSECNAVNVTVYRNFCPECGADMRSDNSSL